MKKYLGLFCILITLQTFSQHTGNIIYNQSTRWQYQNTNLDTKALFQNVNEVTFEINAMYNVKADSYLAIFNLTQVAETAREADSLINSRIDKFRNGCKKAGVKDEGFQVDMLSMVPIYEVEVTKKLFSKTYNEIPAGFEIQKNIHVHFTGAQMLDKIITSAAIEEIYDLVKVDYYVRNVEAVYDSLRSRAMEMLGKRVDEFEELGVPLKDQWRVVIDKSGVFFPLDRYTTYNSFTTTSIDASRKKREIIEMKKPQTLYYNKIPYTGYDIIIEPEIIEPAVQHTYNLQVKFTVEKPVEEPKEVPKEVVKTETVHKFFLVTDQGVIKELPTN